MDNLLEQEYIKIRSTAGICPSGRNLRYTDDLYAKIKAIERYYGIASEQKIIEEAVGLLYKTLTGVSPSEIVRDVKKRLDREGKLQRLQKILAQLKKFHDKKSPIYPELHGIHDFDWMGRLEDLRACKGELTLFPERGKEVIDWEVITDSIIEPKSKRTVKYEPLKCTEGKIALINEEIRLVEEIIDILKDLST
jgi:hypothetical protein